MQALATLRGANVQTGRRIVIYGASGSLGTAAVQLASTSARMSPRSAAPRNVELVRSLGADEVVDYLTEDFTKNGRTYDAIIDAVGKYSFRRGRRSLKPGGIYVATDGVRNLFWALWTWRIGDKRLKFAGGRKTKQDVVFLKELIEAGEYRAVIDRRLPDGAGHRGAPVRRDVAQGGKRRPDDPRRRRNLSRSRGDRETRAGPSALVTFAARAPYSL